MTIFAGGSIFFTFYFSLSPFFIIFAALTLNDMRNKLFGEAPLLRLAVSMMAGIVIGHHVGAGQWLLPVLVGAVVLSLLLFTETLSTQVVGLLLGTVIIAVMGAKQIAELIFHAGQPPFCA